MKRVLVILLAVALLAGCVNKSTTNVGASPKTVGPTVSPTAVASPQTKTYHSAAFGFSVTYDCKVFMAVASRPVSDLRYTWPGLGLVVDGAFQGLVVTLNGPVSRPGLLVNALRPRHAIAAPSLSQFTQRLRGGLAANVHLGGPPQAVALNGLPAIRYTARTGATTSLQYTIYHGPFVYVIALTAPTKLWPAMALKLNAVAQTFTVTR